VYAADGEKMARIHRLPRQGATVCAAWIAALLIAASAGVPRLPESFPAPDYIQYWAASRVNLAGGNPYDWSVMLAAERQAEPALPTPVMMFNPPWTLSLTTLPGLLPYEASRVLWMAWCCIVLSGSSVFLWHYWGGSAARTPIVAVLAILYPPSFFGIVMGQVSPFMLLGIVGFLYFEQRQRFFRAGAVLSLTLVKPQVAYLVWAAVCVWSVHGRRWRMLAGALAAVAMMCIMPLASNSQVLVQYLGAMLDDPPTYFVPPTIGTLLRLMIGWRQTWPMWLPPLAGATWLAFHYATRRSSWRWRADLPLLLFGSVLTAPYAWLHDQVILLPPLLAVAAAHERRASRATRSALLVFAVTAVFAYAILSWDLVVAHAAAPPPNLLRDVLTTANMFWHVTIAPMFLAGFLLVLRRVTWE
jgi:hypothetical protein